MRSVTRFTPRAIRAPLLVAVAGVVAFWSSAAIPRKRPKPPPCPPARYLLPAPLVAGTTAATGNALRAGSAELAIEGAREPLAPKTYAGTKTGTRVRATWPGCSGLDGKVKLKGKIVDDCSTFRGVLRARRFKRRLEGRRSTCGDGIVDRAAGEASDPPQAGACDLECRDTASATIGDAGGKVVSFDGRLTLDVPAGRW
jgi:hypothetical protein